MKLPSWPHRRRGPMPPPMSPVRPTAPADATTRRSRWSARRGSVAVMTALVLVPITFAVGMGYDFSMAENRRDEISGMADAAALAGVTPAMMQESAAQSAATARALFANQIASVPGISYAPKNISVTAADTTSADTVTRNVTVTFKGQSNNFFATLLGVQSLPIGVTSTATSNTTPNINFYVLLDTSPSMEIAATTNGINAMVAKTLQDANAWDAAHPRGPKSGNDGGCAFGCHEADPAADNLGNPNGEDNYALARTLGVTLRIDLVNQAVQNLMQVAQNTENGNGAVYQTAIYTMDSSVSELQSLTADLSAAQGAAGNIQALEVYNNNCLTISTCNNDTDTNIDGALQHMYNQMPPPGNGTNAPNDTPQEILFIVSDGVNDTFVNGTNYTLVNGMRVYTNGTRVYSPVNTLTSQNWCNQIKSTGIRIAFLYTTYNPLPTNSWYMQHVAPEQKQIAQDAQACASPGLFYEVSTDGDISAALASLFEKAVATARLSH